MQSYVVGLLLLLAGASASTEVPREQAQPLKIWRLDCGSIDVDLQDFSDTGLYAGEKRTLSSSCYLVANGAKMLLWDTGLDGNLAGKQKDEEGSLLNERISAQLARIGVPPKTISFVGISHYHYDHTGQVRDFPEATLLIGKEDFEVIRSVETMKQRFAPWLAGGSKVELVDRDKDVFGDGRVVMLDLPGHTPGHHGLLVRLKSGPVLLSGDQYHFREQIKNRGVPSFNTNRADTLASHDRLDRLAANLGAKLIIQHEPRDIAALPAFPNSAE